MSSLSLGDTSRAARHSNLTTLQFAEQNSTNHPAVSVDHQYSLGGEEAHMDDGIELHDLGCSTQESGHRRGDYGKFNTEQ